MDPTSSLIKASSAPALFFHYTDYEEVVAISRMNIGNVVHEVGRIPRMVAQRLRIARSFL